MADLKRPENFVSYRMTRVDETSLIAEISRLDDELQIATSPGRRTDLATRRKLRQIQAVLLEGDRAFDRRRYQEALEIYRQAGELMVGLISPGFRATSTLPGGAMVTTGLTGAAVTLLGNLIPENLEPQLAARQPLRIPPEGDPDPSARLIFRETVAAETLELADVAEALFAQGRWAEAEKQWTTALGRLPADDRRNQAARASLLLNLSAAQTQQGNARGAQESARQARELFRATGDPLGEAEAVQNTALSQLRAGDRQAAGASLKEARDLAGRVHLDALEAPARPGIPRPQIGGATVRPIATVAAPVRAATFLRREADEVAGQIGSGELELAVRLLREGGSNLSKLSTGIAERRQPARQLVLMAGDQAVTLSWAGSAGPAAQALTDSVLKPLAASRNPMVLGLRAVRHAEDLAVRLPHVYHVTLPIKIGDCYHHLEEFDKAQEQYRRAASHDLINRNVEAPDLWRRLAETAAAWGNSLFRNEDPQAALPVYNLVVNERNEAPASFLYTLPALAPTGNAVKAWLAAIRAGGTRPDLNPAISTPIHAIRVALRFIAAGLDIYGNPAHIVPPFTFAYLQEVARYFANQATQAEQRFIDFFDRYETGQLTRLQLEQARDAAGKEKELADQRQREADTMVTAAQTNIDLANTRRDGAQDTLDLFNDTAWEAAQLAGLIARGSAWTGDDLPNLNYTLDGVEYHGGKHEVLQRLTVRQTEISQDLQSSQLQATVDQANAGVALAEDQKKVAEARREGARIETELAELRQQNAEEMLDAFDDRFFDPDQWLRTAVFMRQHAEIALHRSVEVAKLMEKAYNFENFESVKVITRPAFNRLPGGLLGGVQMLTDIDSFIFRRVTVFRHKPGAVKWTLSLAESYPAQFENQFQRTGRIDFEVLAEELAYTFPGTYRHQLAAVEVELDGFLPPEGVHGRLTNSGISRYRNASGQVGIRVQPAETLVLSRYEARRDGVLFRPHPEIRGLFEGSGAASAWALEIPRTTNDLDLRNVFDIRLGLYFECLFDMDLYKLDSAPPPALRLARSRALHLRFAFPEAFFALRETGTAEIDLAAQDFPFNQRQPKLKGLALAAVPENGKTLKNAEAKVAYPGGPGAGAAVRFDAANSVPKAKLPVAGAPSALGKFKVEVPADHKGSLRDLVLLMDYTFQPGA
jgi:tetratricopeptide (TPR) repeat protein